MRNKKDFWIEMSIREIWTQCHFAEIAYSNINDKSRRSTDLIFSSIHSFLSHCAMISKMLKAYDEEDKALSIGSILNISLDSIIHKRKFRNNLEHYDKELKNWIGKYPKGVNIGTYNIGPKNFFKGNILLVSHYDPITSNFTFVNEDFNLNEMLSEVSRVKVIADDWVKNLR